jgi:rubrerythrin
MDLYNTLAGWADWPAVVALLLLIGAFGYWMLNKHIELLKEKIMGLENEIANLKQNTPDVLAQRMANRHKLLTEELERLHLDHKASQEAFEAKKAELEDLGSEINYFGWQLSEAQDLLSENKFVCPHCNSPLVVKEYQVDLEEYGGSEIDVEYEHIVYQCGYELVDGKEIKDCPQRFRPEDYEEPPDQS